MASGDPWVGFTVRQTPSGLSVQVREIVDGSPAESSGLRKGDELVSLNGESIGSLRAFRAALTRLVRVGSVLQVQYLRPDPAGGPAVAHSTEIRVGDKLMLSARSSATSARGLSGRRGSSGSVSSSMSMSMSASASTATLPKPKP
eukprot:RCo022629